ncbi:MAG: hypothetical protein AABZ32_06925, partial [Bacteroidota bacterium]
MKKNKFRILVWVFAICHLPSAICHSQSITNSPYSRYGLGELQYSGFANNISMGGIYNALQNDTTAPFFINVSNPASLASTRLTVFDFGLKSNTMKLETADKSFSSNQTALSYMALAFPVAKWWGASFGLLPYSNVGYKIYDTVTVNNIGKVNYSYEGEGGINQVYLGNGFRKKNFSAGVNVSYLFGDMAYFSRDSFPKASNYFNTKLSQTTRVSDLYYSFGAQYRMQLKKNWSLTLGATGNVQNNINVKKTTFAATYTNMFGVEVMKDTIINEEDVKDTLTIPLMLGGGFVLKKGDKWLFGFDYSMQNWSAFNSFGQSGLLKNSQRMAVGAQFIPNKNAGTKEPYFKKVLYRAGFRYTTSYLDSKKITNDLNSIPLIDYAITFGAGLPLRKVKIGETYSQSIINIGFEIGQ